MPPYSIIQKHSIALCLLWLLAALSAMSCSVINRIPAVEDGYYDKVVEHGKATTEGPVRTKLEDVRVTDSADSIGLAYYPEGDSQEKSVFLRPKPGHLILLGRDRLDVNVFTIPFKIRPARPSLPIQLATSYNAAFYVGGRHERYYVRLKKSPHSKSERITTVHSFGLGGFAGIGATAMNPWTTDYAIEDEYEGMVALAGIAAVYDAKTFNFGLAVGVDHLFGRDRNVWIYQNQPWIGVLFGLNLN